MTLTEVETDLDLLRGQMTAILRQLRGLPGKRNQKKRAELWRRFQGLAAEAKALERRRQHIEARSVIDWTGDDDGPD